MSQSDFEHYTRRGTHRPAVPAWTKRGSKKVPGGPDSTPRVPDSLPSTSTPLSHLPGSFDPSVETVAPGESSGVDDPSVAVDKQVDVPAPGNVSSSAVEGLLLEKTGGVEPTVVSPPHGSRETTV
jgi:hypothetical protein